MADKIEYKCNYCNVPFKDGDMLTIGSSPHNEGVLDTLLHSLWLLVENPGTPNCKDNYCTERGFRGQLGMYWNGMILPQPPMVMLEEGLTRIEQDRSDRGTRCVFEGKGLELLKQYLAEGKVRPIVKMIESH